MSNEDKFSKTIEDEDLDVVAGGTNSEVIKDINFLHAININVEQFYSSKGINTNKIEEAWLNAGISADLSSGKTKNEYRSKGNHVSRQDAMIYAMRNRNKYVDLEKYI